MQFTYILDNHYDEHGCQTKVELVSDLCSVTTVAIVIFIVLPAPLEATRNIYPAPKVSSCKFPSHLLRPLGRSGGHQHHVGKAP